MKDRQKHVKVEDYLEGDADEAVWEVWYVPMVKLGYLRQQSRIMKSTNVASYI